MQTPTPMQTPTSALTSVSTSAVSTSVSTSTPTSAVTSTPTSAVTSTLTSTLTSTQYTFNIDAKYNSDTQKILCPIINNIFEIFDISFDLINIIINNKNTTRVLNFLQKQLYKKMSFYENVEYHGHDLCGQINNIYSNGFIEYCNKHKYIHYNNQIKTQSNDLLDHIFVQKTFQDIFSEKFQHNVKTKYDYYLKNLYHNSYSYIIYLLYNYSTIKHHYLLNESEKLEEQNIFLFKENEIFFLNNVKFYKIYIFNFNAYQKNMS